MIARAEPNLNVPAPIIVGAAALAALAAGRLFAEGQISIALAIVVGAVYVPLVFLEFPLALATWAGMLYLANLSALSVAPNAIGIVLIVGWVAGAIVAQPARLRVFARHQPLFAAVVLFVVWQGLSRIWTENPGLSDVELIYWTSAVVFIVVATRINSMHYVQMIAIAFVAGAVGAVLLSVWSGDLTPGGVGAEASGRLRSSGDPNQQAAGFVAAMFLATGLLAVVRRPGGRLALVAALAIVTFGFFATQSRGGLLAFGFASLLAVVVSRNRGHILALLSFTGAGLAVFLSSNPAALERVTQFSDGGSGREDIWTVAWRAFGDHPFVGSGLNSFQDISARYVLEPGPLEHVRKIAETPHVVHNTYLELLAETGIVGLAIFVFVIGASLRASWLAARRFDAIGRTEQANMARAVLSGTIAMLVAIFFVSGAGDFRLWILFALGPVMHTIAMTATPPAARAVAAGQAGPHMLR